MTRWEKHGFLLNWLQNIICECLTAIKNEMEANMDELKPCIKCGGKGVERIGYGLPYFVCGIPMGRTIGTIIQCSDCGHQTNAYSGDYSMAYKEWNEM